MTSAPSTTSSPALSTTSPTLAPASPAPPGPGAPGLASRLNVAPDCLYFPDGSSSPAEYLSWTVAVPPGASQHVEVSDVAQGLDTGHFASSTSLLAKQAGLSWRPITAGQAYTWRVVTTSAAGPSSTSVTQSFVGQPCLRGAGGETP
ncbi:MAG: hypothetical protein M3137_05025 [Actinomycetota bacterium]|nr:hypothetical protein [Actinomycetota bacterium]